MYYLVIIQTIYNYNIHKNIDILIFTLNTFNFNKEKIFCAQS